MMEGPNSSPQPGADDNEISENDTSSIVPDIIPLEDYNIKKAKLKASLKWMVAKAYTKYEPPPDLKDPFFRDAEGEDHLKPSVIYQLASGELYSMACTHALPPTLHQWQGHWSIIQGLSRKGIYVVDDKEQPVTETLLAQTQRIKLSAHLAMMDAIQRSYVAEMASIEKIVQAVRQISSFSASSELPIDVEDGLLFWMNKVCATVRHKMEKDRKNQQDSLMQSSPQKVRIRREQLQAKALPSIPVMDNLMKDLGDGCCLATVLHFYFPHHVNLDDLSLQEPMSFAESFHNLNIIEDFFQQHLPKMYLFKPEDLLYSPACLKANVLAMLAELFNTCEFSRPEHLNGKQTAENGDSTTEDSINSKLPPLPISSATKKSFQPDVASHVMKSELRNAASNPELDKIASPQVGQQPLLPRRQRQFQNSFQQNSSDFDSLQSQLRRATSLENFDVGKRSFIAWQKQGDRQGTTPQQSMEPTHTSVTDSQTSSLLTNVSLDSELAQSINIDVTESQPQSELFSSVSRPGTYTMPEYVDEEDLEVESLTSALSRVSRASDNMQPPPNLDGAPAVAGSDSNGQQSQYNGADELRESRHPTMRLDSIEQGSEQTNFHKKKLTLDIQPVPMLQDRGRYQDKLMPAVVRPLKEKSHNANKQDERGVLSHSRSPRHTIEQNSKVANWERCNEGFSPDVEPSTPLSPVSVADSLASELSQRNRDNIGQKGPFRVPFQPLNQNISQEPQMAKGKHGEAFYIHASQPEEQQHYEDDRLHESRPYPAGSFTLVDKQYTMESAQQAGIPVVSSMDDGQRSLQHSHQAMESVGGGGSPRILQSNPYSYHPNQQQANPNHIPMHNPHHAHSYSPSHSHSSSPLHTPPQLHTPPPPPPGHPPHYSNPHYSSPHHTPQHSSPLRSSPHQYQSQHASPQHSYHGNPSNHPHSNQPHSNSQFTGSFGGGVNVGGGRVELTRFGSNPGTKLSHTLSAPESISDKESPKLHADQTERESAFRSPVLLNFDSNLSPENKAKAPAVLKSDSQPFTNHLANSSSKEITPITKSQLNDQIDIDPLDGVQANLINNRSAAGDLILPNKPHPKMTSWVSHSKHANDINTGHGAPSHHNNIEPLAIGLAQVRLKLEEKRRNMDKDKRQLERQYIKQRQRVGKAAFLQVIANQKRAKEPEKMVPPEGGTLGKGGNRPYSREEIERSLQDAQQRWLEEQGQQQNKTTFAAIREKSQAGSTHSRDTDGGRSDSPLSQYSGVDLSSKGSPTSSVGSRSPPHMTPEQYTVSIDKMNENMSHLMKEIQKISLQQEQIKATMESPRQQTTESPRQQTNALESPQRAATLPRTGLHRPLSTSSSGSDGSGFVLHTNLGNQPEPQGFFLGGTSPPQTESDSEPFVLQENPLFSMGSEQLSSPTGGPVDQSDSSPTDNYKNTYVVQKPKSRPKLNVDMSATESLASKRGQKLTPIETHAAKSDGPMSVDEFDKSPSQGFRLHSDDNNEADPPQVVEIDSYKAPVGFEIVDEPSSTNSTPKRTPSLRERHREHQKQREQREQQKKAAEKKAAEEKAKKEQAEKAQKRQAEAVQRRRNNSVGSPTKKRPPSVYEIVGENGEELEIEELVVKPLDESVEQDIDDSGDTKVLGFVVAQEKTEEDEIAKRRDQFLRSRLKKQEEEKARKAARDAKAEQLKEEHRKKQDEIEAKKAKEIERREKIRLAYQKRKQKEQEEKDGGPPPPMRDRKGSKAKRPRSRIIDENTDFAKPTISSGPPVVSSQDIAEASMPISKPKSSFTISSSNNQNRNGGGKSGLANEQTTPSHPPTPHTPTSTTAPAGLPSEKVVSPEKPPVPDAVKRRPPSPRIRLKNNGSKVPVPRSAVAGQQSDPRPQSGRFDDSSTAPPSVVSQDSSNDSGGSGPMEYTGPKLFVKPTSKSNRHIITNAIAHCVLAGAVNQGSKDKVLQEVAKSDFKHFVLLFRNHSLQFRALYGYSPEGDEITKIHGTGPRHITHKMIEGLYKYNSGDKSFSKIPSKSMSVQIDGITIANHLWQSKKPSTGKKH